MTQSVLSDFKVLSNKVMSFEFHQEEPIKGSGSQEAHMAFEVMYQNLAIEQVDDQLLGSIDLCVRVKATEKGSEKEVLSVALLINGQFSADSKALPAEVFEEMVCLNGIVVMLHQARSFITASTALAGIAPPVLMPMVNVYELNRAMKGAETDMEEEPN